mgnify:CR=1 FL=1
MSPTVSFNFIQLYTEVCVRYRLSLLHDAPKKGNETYGFKELYPRVVVCEIRKIEVFYINRTFHARRLRVNLGGVWRIH